MRLLSGSVRLVPFLALAFAVAAYWAVEAPPAGAATPTVAILDNDGTLGQAGFDAGTGLWGFAPAHIEVPKGTAVTFNHAATNKRPHTVTDMRAGSDGPFTQSIAAGSKFDSSPTREAVVMPGGAWSLDTSGLDPGHYGYYCRLHPWMVGSITVTGQ